MDAPATQTLLTAEGEMRWRKLAEQIDALYDVDRTWNKGFGDWVYEYKYRRGGKTLCTFYFKQNVVNLLVVLGKAEREKLEARAEQFSDSLRRLYDQTPSYHDGKWLWIPIDGNTRGEDLLELLKIKRRPNRNGCTNQ